MCLQGKLTTSNDAALSGEIFAVAALSIPLALKNILTTLAAFNFIRDEGLVGLLVHTFSGLLALLFRGVT